MSPPRHSPTARPHRWILAGLLLGLGVRCSRDPSPYPPRTLTHLDGDVVRDIAATPWNLSSGLLMRTDRIGIARVWPSSGTTTPLPLDASRVRSLVPPACVVENDDVARCLFDDVPTQLATGVAQLVHLGNQAGDAAWLCQLTVGGAVRCGLDPTVAPSKKYEVFDLDVGALRITQLAGDGTRLCGRAAPDTVRCWTFDPATGGITGSPRDFRGLAGVSDLAVAGDSICAVAADGQILCWGESGCLASTGTSSDVPTPLFDLRGAVQVQLSNCRGCARMSDGGVACWGESGLFIREPGSTSLTPQRVPNVMGATRIAMGWGQDEDCALTAGGKVWCWGGADPGSSGGGCSGPSFYIPN